MKRITKVHITDSFYHFRIHNPDNYETCRVPSWSKKISDSVYKGSKILQCLNRNTDKWEAQSIIIPKDKDNISLFSAKSYAEKILNKLK